MNYFKVLEEASRLADLFKDAALAANRLAIELRGNDAGPNASLAFVSGSAAAARMAEVVEIVERQRQQRVAEAIANGEAPCHGGPSPGDVI